MSTVPRSRMTHSPVPDELSAPLRSLAEVRWRFDLPLDVIEDLTFIEHYEEGKRRGQSDAQIAASMRVTLRTLQLKLQKLRGLDQHAIVERHIRTRAGRDAIALMIDITGPSAKSAAEIAKELGMPIEQALPHINRAVREKYLTRKVAYGEEMYSSTGKYYRYRVSVTPSDRQERALRALYVLQGAPSESVFHWTVNVSEEGEAALRAFFDPKKGPSPQIPPLGRLERSAEKRNGDRERFAVTLTCCTGSPAANESPQNFLLRRVFDWMDSDVDVITTGVQLDDAGIAEFLQNDAASLLAEFRAAVERAAAMPGSCERQITFSFAYGPRCPHAAVSKVSKAQNHSSKERKTMKTTKSLPILLLGFMLIAGGAIADRAVDKLDHGRKAVPAVCDCSANEQHATTAGAVIAKLDHGQKLLG